VRLRRPSFRRSALLLAAVAALHGLVYVPLVDTNEKTDTWSYVASANAILDGSYSTPLQAGFYFVYPVGWFDITGARIPQRVWDEPERQAFRPPGYPAYLALFGKDKVFGGNHDAALIGQALLFGLGAYFLMLTVRRWWGESVALLGGLLYAVDPWSKHYVALVLSETLAGAVALALLYVFTRAWERPTFARWLGAGALAGALSLVRAVFVFTPVLLVLAAVVRSGTTRERLTRAAAAAAASAVLLVPWLAWTHNVSGRATMSVWGEGYNLVLAASGEGHGTTAGDVEADPAFQSRMDRIRAQVPGADELTSDPTAHPRYLASADEQVRDDAFGLYRDRLADTPFDVLWDDLYRMWFLWNAHEDWYQPAGASLVVLQALDAMLIVLALLGAGLAIARGGAGRAAVAFLAVYTVVLGTHHVEARFAMPLRGVFLSLVALTLAAAWGQRRARPSG
jgi:4-amino-4-deoxy-L-arabinose transferase-like glycosyltransferase